MKLLSLSCMIMGNLSLIIRFVIVYDKLVYHAFFWFHYFNLEDTS